MMLVGLTGGMASGKTTASEIFASLGVQVIDTDVIAHALLVSNNEAGRAIIARYGEQLVLEDGTLDRDGLRQRVTEANQLQWLESLLHPLIRDHALAAIEPNPVGYALLVVPLLFETGFDAFVDTTLVVDVDEKTQWSRAMARSGMEEEQLKHLLMRQCKRKQRLQRADRVLDGSADMPSFHKQVIELAALYTKLAAEKK